MNDDEVAAKAAKWDQIAESWRVYCQQGASAFDWDFDSRPLMTKLTGVAVTYWHGQDDAHPVGQ